MARLVKTAQSEKRCIDPVFSPNSAPAMPAPGVGPHGRGIGKAEFAP